MSETIIKQGADLTAETNPQPAAPPSLPEEPVIAIEPNRAGIRLGLREMWEYRELLYFLAWRDIKVRYKQTLLGVAWVVLQPLLMTLIFTIFLGRLARVPSDGLPYPLFIYVGLLPWSFFSSAVTSSGNSLVSSAHLITKVYFPRLIVPAATVAARLVDLTVSFMILGGLMVYYRVPPTRNALMLPALVVVTGLFATGAGTLVSALNVRYRDVGIMLPVLLQLWMFASPVLYPTSLVPAAWRGAYSLNPVVGVIDGFRAAVLARPFDWPALAVSAAVAITLLIGSAIFFRRVERVFADVI